MLLIDNGNQSDISTIIQNKPNNRSFTQSTNI